MDHGGKAGVGLVWPHGDTAEILQITEEILNQMPPLVHYLVNLQWFFPLWALRNADHRTAFIHLVDDPVGIKSFIRQEGVEGEPPDQWLNPYSVVAVAGQQHEAYQIAERVGEGEYFGRPAAF